jgi:tetratricopeptide (TPR) repeat protein
LVFLEERLADRPGDANLLRQAAQAQRAMGRFTDAVDSLRSSSVMAPSSGLADAALGDLYRAQGRLAEAEAAYRRAIDREPEVASHVAGLAATLTAKGERPLALVALAEGQMRVEPAQRSRLDALAHDLRMLSGDAASAEFALAREDGIRSMEADLLWAGHEAARGRSDEAVRRYDALAAAYPDAVEPRLALAELYLRRRDASDRAIAAAGEATRIAPSDAAAWLALARARLASGAESAALEAYHRAIRLAPAIPEGYLGLAALHDAAGRTADARAAYAAGAQAAPGSPALLGAYGLFLTAQGEGEAALAMLDDAVTAAPGAANLTARAAVLAELGRSEDAARDLEDAVSREPGALEPRLALGDLRSRAGDYEGAARAYDAALRGAPGHPAAYLRLSSLALERGDEDAAASWRGKAAAVALAGLIPQ